MRRVLATAAALAALLTATGPADADDLTLPTVTQKLVQGAKNCTRASGTPLAGVPWAQEYLGLDPLTRRTTGAGVRIGLVDTGFDARSAPALAARVRTLPPVYASSLPTLSASGSPITAYTNPDCVGHGTAIASLVVAPAGDRPGVHGLAPGAEVVSVKATDDLGNTDADHLAAAITAVVRAGARIVAVPTGTVRTSAALDAALAAAERADVLVIAPARFDAQTDDAAVYPAASSGVLSVADVGPGGIAPDTTPRGAPVALAAPGDRIVALGRDGVGQVTGSGPSYAVGYVAAAAALLLSYRPGLDRTDLAQRLLRTATPPPGDAPDPRLGVGVLDVRAALDTEFGGDGTHLVDRAPPHVRAAPAGHSGLPVALGIAGGAGAVLLVAAGTAFSVVARRRRFAPAR